MPITYDMATDLQTILQLEVPIIVQVGRRKLALDDVMAFGPGAIIELDRSAEDHLDLLVNNKPVGSGVAVKVGENFGVRITTIDSAEDRIEALSSQ